PPDRATPASRRSRRLRRRRRRGPGAGRSWGTSEDLLLACAVSRHGTASWDAVAKEMQSRCPSTAVFTPTTCRLRFRVLHRRFSGGVTAENEDADGGEEEEEPDAAAVAGWVEELRELRVAELRREVEKYDLSIGSLQSKVKRLKEEREKSISGETKPPPAKEEEEDVRKGSPEEAGAVEDRVSGHESGRSCKESNSSDLKRPENDPAVADDDDREAEEEEEAAAAPAAGDIAVKEEASGESVAGSKEADAEKESSDVQSSASPSRRRRRKGGGGGEEAEAASPSVSVPLPAAEAEPLVAFLESVRTSKAGAVFERRLDSQDGERYSGTIRRHVDLETVRSRLVGATAAACYASASEFYRDMMLLCANALVFFPRGSPEHAAALQLRALVSKQVSKDRQPHAGAKAPAAAAAEEKKKPAKADADIAGPLLEKAPIIVCRKRSSIAKAAAAAAKGEKAEKAEMDKKEKDGSEEKKAAAAATTATAAATAKDKKARGMRTNKSRGPARNQKTAKLSETGEGTKKSDKKGGGGGGSSSAAAAAGGVAKKRNAVDFLNRMNQNGSPSTERVSLLETLKLSAAATEQQKKSSSSSGKGDGRKEAGGSGSKKGAAASTPPGRRIGRPPKRAAAPPTPPPSKRAKDDKPTRKRGKK
uniref:Bromo domain-containing protein n=1 Tax=Oryza glaberrima TaxID=4538 RepID=I1QK21_ORYGL